MGTDSFFRLSDSMVLEIESFIQKKMEEQKNKGLFLNELIREDIFPILDQFCTIVYFPIEDKENNGFHKTYMFRGEHKHFVYINTNQDREKQIFTAAHELGHVWKLDDYLRNKNPNVNIDEEMCEKIMNRFAAELLMPKNIFIHFFNYAVKNVLTDGKVPIWEFIKPITDIMNEFFVPYKAVIWRLFELKKISDEGLKCLWENQDNLIILSKEYAKKQGYSRLYKPDQKKFIEGLQTTLLKAKKEKAFSDSWIESFCNQFEISIEEKLSVPNETVVIQKGDLDG